jgi:hypothetical protein
MVGYYMKNIDKNHFQIVPHNVNGKMMKVGMLELVKYKSHNNEELNMFDTSKCFGACNKIFISTR